jgi:integrase
MKVRLTETMIKAMKAPEGDNYDLAKDSEVRGLALRITPKDARSFVFAYSINGRERRATLGSWPAWSVLAAREKAKEWRRLIESGVDPQEKKRERSEAKTVADIAEQYLERHASKLKSAKKVEQYLSRDVLPVWGKWKAADVRRRDVIELVERKAQETPIAGNMLLSVVRAFFNWAIEKDILEQNPAFKVKPPAPKKQRERWLSEQEIRQFWERLDTAKMEPECRSALRLILITGQRPGEVVGADRSEIDVDTAWWTIPGERAKNGFQHSVPLSSAALEQIEKLKPGRWLIPSCMSADTHTSVDVLGHAVAANREHFDLPRFTAHDLRRTCATHLTKTCHVSQFVVSKILNHSQKGVTAIYDRYSYDAEKKAALDKWDRELRRILGVPQRAKVVELVS